MSTFIFTGISSFESRLSEVDLILDHAKENEHTNQPLYNALCRSAQVLITSHFEGYLKDLIKNAVDDLNSYSTFKDSNDQIKRKFCEYLIPASDSEKSSREYRKKIDKLIDIFDNLNTKFNKDHFLYGNNRNPKTSYVEKISNQFGIKDFFKKIDSSLRFNVVFSNSRSDNIILRDELKVYLIENINNYSYKIDYNYFEISDRGNTYTLWQEFLGEFLLRRHNIAHGNEIDNVVGHEDIVNDRIKIEILSHIFTAFVCIYIMPKVENE